MAWTVGKAAITDDGVRFEFHGDDTDQQGRPVRVQAVDVPFERETPPKQPPPVPAQVMRDIEAFARLSLAAGVAPKVTRLAQVRGAVTRSATRPRVAVAGAASGAGLIQLLVHLL